MSYAGNQDIGTLRYQAANVIYQTTGALIGGDDESDRGVLDDAVLMLDTISSYYTEKDDLFSREMEAIRQDRKKASNGVGRGMELDPSLAESFRWRELKAMYRSLCRQGTFVRQESPQAEWKPGGA